MAITVDINDPEVIESLSFLLVPKEERILNATKPFDSKKNVFVADAKEGYVAGEIQSNEGGKCKVKKPSGEVNTRRFLKLKLKSINIFIKF